MTSVNIDQLVERLMRRDQRAIAQAITLCENHGSGAQALLDKIFPHTGKAIVIGITGTPGSGKSTLVDQLALEWRRRGQTVGIIAVDPSSPFSGGAVLGDRIRMSEAVEDNSIYMRSLAARGALGGLSRATHNALHILDAAGFDVILVETVGVGQAEVEIINLADTVLVVVVPGLGDSVQAVKAGVLEIADIFVVNKYDRDGAGTVHRDIRNLLGLVNYTSAEWQPQIVDTIATQGKGVPELVNAVGEHQIWLEQSNNKDTRRLNIMRAAILKASQEMMAEKLNDQNELNDLALNCLSRKITPVRAAEKLLKMPPI